MMIARGDIGNDWTRERRRYRVWLSATNLGTRNFFFHSSSRARISYFRVSCSLVCLQNMSRSKVLSAWAWMTRAYDHDHQNQSGTSCTGTARRDGSPVAPPIPVATRTPSTASTPSCGSPQQAHDHDVLPAKPGAARETRRRRW